MTWVDMGESKVIYWSKWKTFSILPWRCVN